MAARRPSSCILLVALALALLFQTIYIFFFFGSDRHAAAHGQRPASAAPLATDEAPPCPSAAQTATTVRPSTQPLSDGLPAAHRQQLQELQWDMEALRQRLLRAEGLAHQLAAAGAASRARLDVALSALLLLGPNASGSGRATVTGHRPEKVPCICRDMSPTGQSKPFCNAQQATVGSAHVCTFANTSVCITTYGPFHKSKLLFRQFGGAPAPVITILGETDWSNTTPVTVAGVETYGVRVYPDNAAEWARLAQAPVVAGTTVLYSSRFMGHITHVLEGAGSLYLATHREAPAGRPPCAVTDPFCIGRIGHFTTLGLTGPSDGIGLFVPNSWHENVLRMVIGDVNKTVRFERDLRLLERLTANVSSQSGADAGGGGGASTSPVPPPVVCFEKVVIPSFYYGIFPDGEDTLPFQATVVRYLKQNAFLTGIGPGRTTRKILLAKRGGKRTIVDWDVLEQFVRRFAEAAGAKGGGVPIQVQVVEFGAHGFEAQACAAASSDILMGLHGADLTNMMFMRKGSVVIELNPLFFFENRFFEIATNLGLHYMAWTCTHEDCAFGGAMRQRFRSLVSQAQYDKATMSLAHDGHRFVWPADRPVSLSCPQCNAIVSPGGVLHSSFHHLRDSDVRVSGSLHEIQSVLNKALVALRWLDGI